MMGVSTLSLCSTNSMVVHSQAQYTNLAFVNNGKVLALTGSKMQRLTNRRDSFPVCLVPSISTISFKKSRPHGPFTTAVGAVASDQLTSEAKRYYFVVANAKFLLDEEEHFQEQLFERLRLFGERNEEQDFWLVIEPKLLDKFPNITKRLKRPAVALVSTTFMKLRLDRVLTESFEAKNLEEALACNPTNLKFEKPEKWVAPYPKYEYGWWKPFLPHGHNEV